MNRTYRKAALLLACLLGAGGLHAQQTPQESTKWEVGKHQRSSKTLSFTTDEGTWMNVDISPDGKDIVFDMLGDIYLMPATGGKARLLRGGLPFEVQPRFSPDGKKIAFTSDAAGGDNLWVMDRDGGNAKAITSEDFRLLNNPTWTPDGQYLIARKHFTFTRSAGAGALWMYHISGGSGTELVPIKNEQQDINEPCVSPDGRYLYYAEDMYPGGYFQYNKNPNELIYALKRYDRERGTTTTLVDSPGGAHSPQTSRDGRFISFIKRVREKTVLHVLDTRTGQVRPVYDGLSRDQQEAWALFGVYTKYNWMPDNQHILIWSGGKLRKIDVQTGKDTVVPFEVDAVHEVADAVRFQQQVAPDAFKVKVVRQAQTSPDGKTLVFHAAGYIWKKALPDGKPQRLTTQTAAYEYDPAFSPDGKRLLYTSWSDAEKGAIWSMDLVAKKSQPRKLTPEKGIYRTPRFSPDGKLLVYQKEEGNDQQGYDYCVDPGIYVMNADGSAPRLLNEFGENPYFDKNGTRVYYQTGGLFMGSLKKAFRSMDLQGQDIRTHFASNYATQFTLSPDNQWVTFVDLHKVYVAPMPQVGKTIDLSANTKAVPVAQLAKDAGINLHWSADSKRVCWTLGDQYFSANLKDRFTYMPEGPEQPAAPMAEGLPIGLELPTDKPQGLLALTGARIITANAANEVIEDGVVLVRDNRIQAIGRAGAVTIPADAKVMEMKGKTIMPGIVDAHAHVGHFRMGMSAQQNWPYLTNLAYGVTTTHDPSANSEMVFGQSEMVKAGQMMGPRIFSTGVILYGADGDFKAVVNSLDDARSAIRRTKAFGAFSVKSYNQPRRNQRQQVLQAAQEEGIIVVPEGGSHFYHNMSMILDGHTGIEHNIPVYPVYKDVKSLWSFSKTGYTPTLIVNYASMSGEYYWYQHSNVWENKRLLQFTPRPVVDARSRHRVMIPEEEYQRGHILSSQTCKALTDVGVKVNLGGHGQLQGLGCHWELWMLAQGGMTPMEALRAATINGAEYLGLDKDLGSLEAGKLADLVVLDANPLENIRHSEQVRYTMVNGRMYDTATMDEVGLRERKAQPMYWQRPGYSDNFPTQQRTQGFTLPGCGCGKH